MVVFVSWAGQASKELAKILREFIPVVVQECQPFMSEIDIMAGQPWDITLESQLKAAKFGVLCLTPDNLGSAYLHYEAGAIANQVTQNYVCPLLLGDLTSEQLAQPLGRFQAKKADKAGLFELFRSVNSVASNPLREERLQKAFDGQWQEVERSITAIKMQPTAVNRRTTDEMLTEILQHVRTFARPGRREPRAPIDRVPTPVKRAPRGMVRRYTSELAGRIYPTLGGTFEWSLENTQAKAVLADGEASSIDAAAEACDAAAGMPGLELWSVE